MTVTATQVWLTTLGAVDDSLRPGRQVGDHPTSRDAPVWVFVYEGSRPGILYADEAGNMVRSPSERRVLHVADAMNAATREGAFVYIYGWSELGNPELPSLLPTIPEP